MEHRHGVSSGYGGAREHRKSTSDGTWNGTWNGTSDNLGRTWNGTRNGLGRTWNGYPVPYPLPNRRDSYYHRSQEPAA